MTSTATRASCPKCQQKILQSLSKRCMYCGAELPSELQPSDDTRQAILSRAEESNKVHDLAMEAKDKKKNKKGKPQPPTDLP